MKKVRVNNVVFRIDNKTLRDQMIKNPDLRKKIKNKDYTFSDGYLCKVKEGFIFKNDEGHYVMTQFAKDNPEECCIGFDVYELRADNEDKYQDMMYFNQLKEVEVYYEYSASNEVGELDDRKLDIDPALPADLSGTLSYYIHQRKQPISQLASRSLMPSYRLTRLIEGDTRPKLGELISLCIGLQLEPHESFDLLQKSEIETTPLKDKDLIEILLYTMNKRPIDEARQFIKDMTNKELLEWI